MDISEEVFVEKISGEELDNMLSKAWRRFGHQLFRYSSGFIEQESKFSAVVPLRIRLADFEFTKRQRKILRKNSSSFQVKKGLIDITFEKIRLFHLHSHHRFQKYSILSRPSSIHDFIAVDAKTSPIPTYEISVYDKDKLIAASFVDISTNALSSIYAIYDTDYQKYSLGNYTLFEEILWAKELGKKYLYLGYAYQDPSFYDYKKRFKALEQYLWQEDKWVDFEKIN